MKISLIGIFHCCVNYDPPTGEELHRGQVQTCVSGQVWGKTTVNQHTGEELKYQNSRSYGRDGVSPLAPVDVALTIPASDPVQET